MVRSASVRKRNIPLSFHSDLPMAPSDPLNLAWAAVNRTTPSARAAGPDQRISVDDAVRAFTIEAAYSWRKENELGSVAPGTIANFTVLEQNPLAVQPMKLTDIPVWGTVFEGRLFPVPAERRRASVTHINPFFLSHASLRWHDHANDHHGGDSCDMARLIVGTLAANGLAEPGANRGFPAGAATEHLNGLRSCQRISE